MFETASGFCGIAWHSAGITQTRERGRYVIRFAIGQRSATRGHVQQAWQLIQQMARRAHATPVDRSSRLASSAHGYI